MRGEQAQTLAIQRAGERNEGGSRMRPSSRLLGQPIGWADVTPSVLHPKSFTKTYLEHDVYVLMHAIECVDKFLVTENDQ